MQLLQHFFGIHCTELFKAALNQSPWRQQPGTRPWTRRRSVRHAPTSAIRLDPQQPHSHRLPDASSLSPCSARALAISRTSKCQCQTGADGMGGDTSRVISGRTHEITKSSIDTHSWGGGPSRPRPAHTSKPFN